VFATRRSVLAGAFLLGSILLLAAAQDAGAVKETFDDRVRERRAELIDRAVERGWNGHFVAMLYHPDPRIHESGLDGLRSYFSEKELRKHGKPGDRARSFRILKHCKSVISYLRRDPRGLPEDLRQLVDSRFEEAASPFPGEGDSWIYDDGNFNWPLAICAWAILTGEEVGDRELVEKGKRNLELCAHRLHALGPGTPGEINSPHYQDRSQTCLATIANYARDPDARLLAEVMLERLYLGMVSRYHAPSQRLGGPWGRAYAGEDVGARHNATLPLNIIAEQPPFFDDRAAGEVGNFASTGTIPLTLWAVPPFPDYLLWIAERKSLPYLVQTQTKCQDYWRGGPEGKDVWPGSWGTSTTYHTPEYVLGSLSRPYVDDGHGKVCIAHWRRAKRIQSMADFRTLYTHYTFNERKPVHPATYYNWDGKTKTIGGTFWHNDGRGMVTQHKGKAVVLYHPKTFEAQHVNSMKLDVALPLYTPLDGLYVNERRVEKLPAEADYDDLILIQDADVYAAVRPLKPVQLGGPRKVYISEVKPRLNENFVDEGGPKLKCHLLISIYNYYDPSGELKKLGKAGDPAFRLNCNGLILELATRDEYPSLAEFRSHIRSAKVTDQMAMAKGQKAGEKPQVRRVTYSSGEDTIVAAYRLTTETYVERTVNGRPVEPDMFESPLAAESKSGAITLGKTTCGFDKGVPLTVIALEGPAKYAVINVLDVPTRVELQTPHGSVSTASFGRGVLRFYPDQREALVEVRAARLLASISIQTRAERLRVTLNGNPLAVAKKGDGRWEVRQAE